MRRYWVVDSLVLGCTALVLAAPAVALADVLEIGSHGAAWITGGPVQAADQDTAQYAKESGDESGPELGAHRVTVIPDSAGPAQWRGRVAELAAKYDISPDLLEAVVWQESRWRTGAVSPVGARGLTQLMPGTARQMGVNPHDPHANLEGGARYLRMQLDAFGGDVEKALAAYNAGPGRVIAAGGIPRIRETQNYVASIMARLSDPVRR
ncbi:MAG: lytic transglycosylase domain-containing protein [Novosphingobium sp.]